MTEARNLLAQLTGAAPDHTQLTSLTESVHSLEARERGKAAEAAYEDGKRLQQAGSETELVAARSAYRQAIEQYKRALFLLGDCGDCEKALRDLQQP